MLIRNTTISPREFAIPATKPAGKTKEEVERNALLSPTPRTIRLGGSKDGKPIRPPKDGDKGEPCDVQVSAEDLKFLRGRGHYRALVASGQIVEIGA